MTFNSLAFIAFLAPVLICYYGLPGRWRAVWVLIASLVFYTVYNWKVVPCLIAYALIVYTLALWLEPRSADAAEEEQPAKKSLPVKPAAAVILLLLPLIVCKYSGFLLTGVGLKAPRSLILPLGISYFSFKSIGYLVDVVKGKAEAETNVLRLMAFVTFFPEILTGPIDRSDNLLVQLKEERPALCGSEVRAASLMFLAGCFEKMVIADRIGLGVDAVYASLTAMRGLPVLAAAFGYSLQIYFDFAGCTLMALGIGRLMGFRLPANFRRPYLAVSAADFWRRWHISLTSWLRDYIYIPLGGNRKGTARKYLNVMIVFLISGLWHGAGWTFVVWGALNGAYQVIESFAGSRLKKQEAGPADRASDDRGSQAVVWLRRIGVFVIMTAAWVFFRASSLSEAGAVFSHMGFGMPASEALAELTANAGLAKADLVLLAAVLILMLVLEVTAERGRDLLQWVTGRPFIVRCLIFYGLIFGIILFGIYGTAYNAASFIYLQF